MAPAQSKRRSRKRRRSAASRRTASGQVAQAPVRQPAPATRATRHNDSSLGAVATTFTGRTYGDPPPNLFGGVPVAEVAIFAGGIGVIVGWATKSPSPLVVGIIVCALGVAEVTAREHFCGYRSHTLLLAGMPAVGVGVAMIALFGGSLSRGALLLVVLALFGVLFWQLRRRFRNARQARLVRPPAP